MGEAMKTNGDRQLRVDWKVVCELRERFWRAEREKAEIRRQLQSLTRKATKGEGAGRPSPPITGP